MTNIHLLPAVPYRLPLVELLRQADLLPSHVLVYLPTRDEVVAFTPDTAVLLLDSGAYDEHLALDAASQPVELSFPGLSASFTVELVQQVLETARAEGPDTPEFYVASLTTPTTTTPSCRRWLSCINHRINILGAMQLSLTVEMEQIALLRRRGHQPETEAAQLSPQRYPHRPFLHGPS